MIISPVHCITGNCNFETGMCTWTNPDGIDDFDWLLGRGNTKTDQTGPAFDHTLGNATGEVLQSRSTRVIFFCPNISHVGHNLID